MSGTGVIKHGHARAGKHTSEYTAWENMIKRCHKLPKTHRQYKDYMGRGLRFVKDGGTHLSVSYQIWGLSHQKTIA